MRRAAEAAVIAGFLALAVAGGWLFWTRHTGSDRAVESVQSLRQEWIETPAEPAALQKPRKGKAFAVMSVPRFGLDWEMPVFEGTGAKVLRGGVGHYPSTALPGEVGNFAVAGHRTTWARPFRDVDRLRDGDTVIVRTRQDRFTYRVTGHEIVDPDETEMLDPVPGEPGASPSEALLTLTTCHPEYSDRERWIVRAVLVQSVPLNG